MASLTSTDRQGTALTGQTQTNWPAHTLSLTDLGLDRDAFIRDVRPSFDRTEWDMYDVANRRTQLEQAGVPDPVQLRAMLDAIKPHRRRAMRKYELSHAGGSRWRIAPSDDRTFTQAVDDSRARTREFALIEPDVSMHEGILTLLASLGETVRRHRPAAARIHTVIHQMTVIARPAEVGAPAPEGLHQDGCDYIVSALVIERKGVSGGVSRIRMGREGTPFLEVQLAPGEGIFQADAGTTLWHEVSPIRIADGADAGHRMAFGVDIHVA